MAPGRQPAGENGTVTFAQPMLSLWPEPAPDHRDRLVARSRDRVAWLRARSRGITATDAARLSSARSVKTIALEKVNGSSFGGNAYTDHGRAREPEIARWVHGEFGIVASDGLFHAHGNARHLATPDGLGTSNDGTLVLAEIKTTKSAWQSIPRSYLRQVWWQQYVLGADRTLLVWEQHLDFIPVNALPECKWIERDDNEIHKLVSLADEVLAAVTVSSSGGAASTYRAGAPAPWPERSAPTESPRLAGVEQHAPPQEHPPQDDYPSEDPWVAGTGSYEVNFAPVGVTASNASALSKYDSRIERLLSGYPPGDPVQFR